MPLESAESLQDARNGVEGQHRASKPRRRRPKAQDVSDREVLMVIAATCEYGWEFMNAEPFRRPVQPTESHPFVERHGDMWMRYGAYTHGGPPDGGIGATRWGIGLELWEYPERVLVAKLRSLRRRRLVQGCTCGCRGDFVITEAGKALVADEMADIS